MKHVIFSDIDGTLYNSKKEMHPDVIKDIEFAQSLGVEFIFATGNGYFKNIRQLAERFNTKYVLCSNGASVYDIEKNKFIFESVIPKESAQELLDFANKHEVSANWWDEENIYVNNYAKKDLKEIIEKVMTLDDPILQTKEIKKDIFKIEFYDDPNKIDLMMSILKDKNLQLARMSPNHVEVTHLNVSKGHAIEIMAKELGFDMENTMGIGDSANDLVMLETVNHSYAMGNGKDIVKKTAKHHTSTVEQNGLGEAIQDFIYRQKIGK